MLAAGADSAVGGGHAYVYAGYARPFEDDDLDLVRRFVIADAYARFRRSQGDAVLFALAIESFGEAVESRAAQREASPADLIEEYRAQLRQRFEDLLLSCDWACTVVTSEPEHRLRAQLIFLALLEADLVYRRDPPGEVGAPGSDWFIRSSRFAEKCERGLEVLSGWTAEALETQRSALGRVDGVEVEAVLLGAGNLLVFTPFPDSIADATFVAVSPHHPEVDAIASPAEIAPLRGDPDGAGLVETGMQAAVPGVEGLLPVVVTPSVDARFGPTATLGIPGRAETDRQIAERLRAPSGSPLRTASPNSKPRPAARHRLTDIAVSRETAWGTPIPIVNCHTCGVVPIAADGLAETQACPCPRCGGPAERDRARIDSSLDSMWIWLSICVPPADLEPPTLAHPDCERWLPARQVVWSTGDGGHLLQQRLSAQLADELGLTQPLAGGEPFARALVHGSVDSESGDGDDIDSIEKLDELVARAGADVARFALLHAAAPGKSTRLSGHSVRHAERFLRELREQAEQRFGTRDQPIPAEIDRSTRLRRRLAAWCRIAAEKIATHTERLDMHRATYDMTLLLRRIQDFENRCANDGEIAPADGDAVAVALLRLVCLVEPFAPETAAELEAVASEVRSPASIDG